MSRSHRAPPCPRPARGQGAGALSGAGDTPEPTAELPRNPPARFQPAAARTTGRPRPIPNVSATSAPEPQRGSTATGVSSTEATRSRPTANIVAAFPASFGARSRSLGDPAIATSGNTGQTPTIVASIGAAGTS